MAPPLAKTVAVRESPPPQAKAAHCAVCDARFVPESGAVACPDCAGKEAARRKARAGFTRCRVVGNVMAVGTLEGGHIRTTWADGEVGEFADADVLSVPASLLPLEG